MMITFVDEYFYYLSVLIVEIDLAVPMTLTIGLIKL